MFSIKVSDPPHFALRVARFRATHSTNTRWTAKISWLPDSGGNAIKFVLHEAFKAIASG